MDREGVERGLSLVKSWIQDSRDLLLNPTSDLDVLTQELEVKKICETVLSILQYFLQTLVCFTVNTILHV